MGRWRVRRHHLTWEREALSVQDDSRMQHKPFKASSKYSIDYVTTIRCSLPIYQFTFLVLKIIFTSSNFQLNKKNNWHLGGDVSRICKGYQHLHLWIISYCQSMGLLMEQTHSSVHTITTFTQSLSQPSVTVVKQWGKCVTLRSHQI